MKEFRSAPLPLPALVGLICDGKEVARADGKSEFAHDVLKPGAYQLEAWLKLDDDWRPRIYSSPIYLR